MQERQKPVKRLRSSEKSKESGSQRDNRTAEEEAKGIVARAKAKALHDGAGIAEPANQQDDD